MKKVGEIMRVRTIGVLRERFRGETTIKNKTKMQRGYENGKEGRKGSSGGKENNKRVDSKFLLFTGEARKEHEKRRKTEGEKRKVPEKESGWRPSLRLEKRGQGSHCGPSLALPALLLLIHSAKQLPVTQCDVPDRQQSTHAH